MGRSNQPGQRKYKINMYTLLNYKFNGNNKEATQNTANGHTEAKYKYNVTREINTSSTAGLSISRTNISHACI